MSRLRIICSFTLIIFILISLLLSSCKSGKTTCKEKQFHKTYNTKKNRSNYNQKYSSKTRSIKKDYRIRNGIAN
jgi:hypothetical protein